MLNLCLRGIKRAKSLQKELENVACGIQEIVPGADLSILLEPESKRRKVYSVSIIVRGLREDVVVTRHESKVHPLIQSAKRELIKKLNQLKEKEKLRLVSLPQRAS